MASRPHSERRKTKKRASSETAPLPAEPVRGLPWWKTVLFAVVTTVGFFVLLEGALALVGVKPTSYSEDPYVGFASNIPLFVEQTGTDGREYMVTSPAKDRWFNKQRFLRNKPKGAYRIFSLGGSSTYGRPYDDRASFSAWLRELLPAADPGHKWEVINAGGISYASYRVALLMAELIRYEPDLFIIYSGHNEFLERRTYGGAIETPRALTEVGGLLSRTHIYQAGSRLVAALWRRPAAEENADTILGGEVDTILDHSVGPSAYSRDDKWEKQVMAHYRFNLNRMINIARSAGAKVVLVTPASNLSDCAPFKSEHPKTLIASARQRFDELFGEATKAQAEGRLEDALAAFDEALRIDGRYAALLYQRGRVLYKLGRFAEAKEAFSRARDEDICPLRALGAEQRIVTEVASKRHVPLLDFESVVESKSDHGIPGSGLFLDHVHLTVDGYGLLARGLVRVLAGAGIVKLSGGWNEAALERVSHRIEARIDKHEEGVALRNLAKVLHWAGKQEESEKLVAKALGLLGQDAESFAMLGRDAENRGDTKEAENDYRKALRLEPGYAEAHFSLATLLLGEHRLDEAIAHFREALREKPDYGVAEGGLAMALAAQGKSQEAVAHYREAIRLSPNYAEPHNDLGIVLASERRADEAIEEFHEAIRINPRYAEAHVNLGVALSAKGDWEGALGEYRRALELEPDYPDAHRNYGIALSIGGKFENAAEQFRETLRLDPNDAKAHYLLGNALQSLGRASAAAAEFRKAARLAPGSTPPAPRRDNTSGP